MPKIMAFNPKLWFYFKDDLSGTMWYLILRRLAPNRNPHNLYGDLVFDKSHSNDGSYCDTLYII